MIADCPVALVIGWRAGSMVIGLDGGTAADPRSRAGISAERRPAGGSRGIAAGAASPDESGVAGASTVGSGDDPVEVAVSRSGRSERPSHDVATWRNPRASATALNPRINERECLRSRLTSRPGSEPESGG